MRAYRRAAGKDRLPTLAALARAVPRYLRRGYHPLQEGDTCRARAYLAASPAVTRAVTAPG